MGGEGGVQRRERKKGGHGRILGGENSKLKLMGQTLLTHTTVAANV